jgi:hypothetical protein
MGDRRHLGGDGSGAAPRLDVGVFWLDNPSVTVGPTSIRPGPGWYLSLVASAATIAGGQLMRLRPRPVEQLELFDDENGAADLQRRGFGV